VTWCLIDVAVCVADFATEDSLINPAVRRHSVLRHKLLKDQEQNPSPSTRRSRQRKRGHDELPAAVVLKTSPIHIGRSYATLTYVDSTGNGGSQNTKYTMLVSETSMNGALSIIPDRSVLSILIVLLTPSFCIANNTLVYYVQVCHVSLKISGDC
jgi:hypothetical protein